MVGIRDSRSTTREDRGRDRDTYIPVRGVRLGASRHHREVWEDHAIRQFSSLYMHPANKYTTDAVNDTFDNEIFNDCILLENYY